MKERTKKLFKGSVIGMVHLLPLPGVPGHSGMARLVESALRDTEALVTGGVDALLIENMNDFPCVREQEMGPEVAASMTRVAGAIRRTFGAKIAVGIQVLFAANRTAIAVAKAADLDFIRAEGWTYGHLSDKGWVEASAGTVVRYRQSLGADDVLVLADVKKKHASHAVTADVPIVDAASNLEFQAADGVVVTGTTTGRSPSLKTVRAVRKTTTLPMVIGSGMTARNVGRFAISSDAVIVGSSLKGHGDWRKPVDRARVEHFVDAYRNARSANK